jgi:hypothetical protein
MKQVNKLTKEIMMTTVRLQKPRLSVSAYALLSRVDEYIVRYDLNGPRLSDAASDVLDGLVSRCEIDELVRKKILSIVRYEPVNKYSQSNFDTDCGRTWTVVLTKRAISKLWPSRAHDARRVLQQQR